LGSLRDKNSKSLAQLTKDVKAIGEKPAITRTNTVSIPKPENIPDESEPENFNPSPDDAEVQVSIINNEAKFASTNIFDLPDLLPDRIATPDQLPSITFNRSPETFSANSYFCESTRPFTFKSGRKNSPSSDDDSPAPQPQGTLGFFTEDWRFERVYADADIYGELLQQEQWRSVLTPDFSTYTTWPLPIQLFNVYRSRWCGRLWQELGLTIVPTIQYMGARTDQYVIKTLPKPCHTIAIQTRKYSGNDSRDYSAFVNVIKSAKKFLNIQAVLIYGNPNVAKYTQGFLPKKVEYIWLEEFTTARRKTNK
jgi:hypothetical protein